eukprot:TRINITY_DN2785_c0_g1_i2.p1 TRINITY_DN2785_c0_g1~~TRINITY_DN2785_c0_g1_i2.p1  ORF type:complete len:667 (+),score=202.75 TRINITY_DN2785_c0_g1_i2:76-2076(+)
MSDVDREGELPKSPSGGGSNVLETPSSPSPSSSPQTGRSGSSESSESRSLKQPYSNTPDCAECVPENHHSQPSDEQYPSPERRMSFFKRFFSRRSSSPRSTERRERDVKRSERRFESFLSSHRTYEERLSHLLRRLHSDLVEETRLLQDWQCHGLVREARELFLLKRRRLLSQMRLEKDYIALASNHLEHIHEEEASEELIRMRPESLFRTVPSMVQRSRFLAELEQVIVQRSKSYASLRRVLSPRWTSDEVQRRTKDILVQFHPPTPKDEHILDAMDMERQHDFDTLFLDHRTEEGRVLHRFCGRLFSACGFEMDLSKGNDAYVRTGHASSRDEEKGERGEEGDPAESLPVDETESELPPVDAGVDDAGTSDVPPSELGSGRWSGKTGGEEEEDEEEETEHVDVNVDDVDEDVDEDELERSIQDGFYVQDIQTEHDDAVVRHALRQEDIGPFVTEFLEFIASRHGFEDEEDIRSLRVLVSRMVFGNLERLFPWFKNEFWWSSVRQMKESDNQFREYSGLLRNTRAVEDIDEMYFPTDDRRRTLDATPYMQAIDTLSYLEILSSPFDMAMCITTCANSIYKRAHVLSDRSGKEFGADQFLPIFVYVLIHSDINNPHACLHYIYTYSNDDDRDGELGYYLTSFEGALMHVEHIATKIKEDADGKVGN